MALLELLVKRVEVLRGSATAITGRHRAFVALEDLLVRPNRRLVPFYGLLVVLELEPYRDPARVGSKLLFVVAAPPLQIAGPGLVLRVILEVVLVVVLSHLFDPLRLEHAVRLIQDRLRRFAAVVGLEADADYAHLFEHESTTQVGLESVGGLSGHGEEEYAR